MYLHGNMTELVRQEVGRSERGGEEGRKEEGDE
jgi:hypothetical protein